MSMEIKLADRLKKEPRLNGHDTETAVALGYAAVEAKTKAYCRCLPLVLIILGRALSMGWLLCWVLSIGWLFS